jgi:hypothetical protein
MNSHKSLKVLVFLLPLLMLQAGLLSCKKWRKVGRTAYIVGPTNDIVSARNSAGSKSGDQPSQPLKILNSTAVIATKLKTQKIKFCSGTLISPAAKGENYRILTNHHCFAMPGKDGHASETLYPESCEETEVFLGFDGNLEPFKTICQSGSLTSNFLGDLAVFVLENNPLGQYRPLELFPGDGVPKDRKAFIVHYPDLPEHYQRPKGENFALPTAAVTENDCMTLGPFAVSEWDLDRTLPFSLRHTCDLVHGSSGSALIDAKTMKILGVNWGGIKITRAAGTVTDNVATNASFVRSFLAGESDLAVNNAARDRSQYMAKTESSDKKQQPKNQPMQIACGTLRDGANTHQPQSSLLFVFLLMIPTLAAMGISTAKR